MTSTHTTNNSSTSAITPIKHIISSATATGIAEIVTLPLCTIKTNFQNTNGISVRETCKHIYSKYGMKGFYNASGWAITSQILSTTTKYTWYQILKDYTPNVFVAGATSGVLSSLLTHPLDVLKIHYQMHTPFLPELNKYGLRLFYRGYSKTLTKSTFGSIFFFPLYDIFKLHVHNNTLAAMMSAIISTTCMQPIDYMKTRHIYGQPFFSGWNIRPYFKGLSLNLMRVVPHFMVTMTVIEQCKKYL